jgi:hypothetical protein
MRLSEYIKLVDGSRKAFADRTCIPLSTVNRIADEEVRCRIDIATRIVRASHSRPTQSGGVVTYEELEPPAESVA